MERKKELRKSILKIRNELEADERKEKSLSIMNKLLQNKYFLAENNILIYINYGSEVNTEQIISYCIQNQKNVACPKVISECCMEFYKIDSLLDLQEGYRGILEPKTKEIFEPESALVIVPGVAFDRQGYRIGYGKGFYDRYLMSHPDYKTIALAYRCQIVDSIPKEEHDIKIMQFITD